MVSREILVAKIAAADTVFKDAIANTVASTFTRYRVDSFSDGVDRGDVSEESIDQVSDSRIDGGTYVSNGNFSGSLRVDPSSIKLIEGFMGKQDVGTPANTYYMEQVPQEMQIFAVDEQANSNAGTGTYYQGVGIESMEINLEVKKQATAKWGWIGQRGVTTDTPVNDASPPDYDDYPYFVFYNAVLTFGGSAVRMKSLTLTAERKFDKDYIFIGSQFLQGLYYNGKATLGGTFTLGSGEWDLLERTINGTTSPGGLDGAHTQFTGVNDNAIASGTLVISFNKPTHDATHPMVITVQTCKITSMNRSVTGRNQWEKSVKWKGQVSEPSDFSIVVTPPT